MRVAGRQRLGLTREILTGMACGIAAGTALRPLAENAIVNRFLLEGVLYVGGSIFLASLKLLVVPLVFVSLVCGTAALDDVSRLGRVGLLTLTLYLTTTAVAISLALAGGALVKPGAGFDLTTSADFVRRDAPGLADTIVAMFPTNPVAAMAEGNMLQVIIFAGLFGLSLTLAGDKSRRVLSLFEELNVVIMKMVMLLMEIAPYGIFCLLARVFAAQGLSAIAPLASYFLTVSTVLLLHGLLTYPIMLRLLAGLGPLRFLRSLRGLAAVAFSTASSNATIPVTFKTGESKLGVDNSIASFTVPLGATINMDGTAIMQGVATAFIAQAYGIEIGLGGYLTVVLMATMASVGTAGVPGVGLITLAMVLDQVGLPVEGIGLIIGVDRLLDMMRTVVNVSGDAAVSCVVAKREGKLLPVE